MAPHLFRGRGPRPPVDLPPVSIAPRPERPSGVGWPVVAALLALLLLLAVALLVRP